MNVIIGAIFSIVVFAAVFIGGINVVVWSINDIITSGANFWNILWITVVSMVIFGVISKATH